MNTDTVRPLEAGELGLKLFLMKLVLKWNPYTYLWKVSISQAAVCCFMIPLSKFKKKNPSVIALKAEKRSSRYV